MNSDPGRLFFGSVEIDKDYSLTLATLVYKKCVRSGHTSLNEGLSTDEQGRQRRENLGTRLGLIILDGDI